MLNIINHQGKANQNHNDYHLPPVRRAIFKQLTNNKCWWGGGEKEPSCTIDGIVNDAVTMESKNLERLLMGIWSYTSFQHVYQAPKSILTSKPGHPLLICFILGFNFLQCCCFYLWYCLWSSIRSPSLLESESCVSLNCNQLW